MKHIVIIVGSYYPYYSAVGKCLGNIAAEFEKEYKVTVLCEKNKVGQDDRDILNSQNILRITTKLNNRRVWIDEEVKNKKGITLCVYKVLLFFAKMERYLRKVLSKSACDNQLVNAYENGLETIDDPIDIIIPTCNPFESVVAAMNYQEKRQDVIIIPFLFDLFSENININRGKLLLKYHWKKNILYEKKMFEKSACVFHVANWTHHIEQYLPEYKEKSHEVEHPLLVCEDNSCLRMKDDYIHVVYTGVVDTNVRNPERVLKALIELNAHNVRFDFYSFGSAEKIVEHYAEQSRGIIVAHGQVDSDEAQNARKNADILLSIGNDSNSMQTPSKLMEYFASGKPIIHFAQNEADSSISVLKKYPYAKVIDLSANVNYADLLSFIIEKSNAYLTVNEIKSLFREADPEQIVDEIKNYFGGV